MADFNISQKSLVTAVGSLVDVFPLWQAGAQHTANAGQILASHGGGVQAGPLMGMSAISIASVITAIRTSGYNVSGDGGGGLYKRVSVMPTHLARFQSGDGAWWELVPAGGVIDPKQLGAIANGTVNDTASMIAAEAAAFTLGVHLFFSQGTYTFNGVFTIRVSVYSKEATVKQLSTTIPVVNYNNSTLYFLGVTNLVVQGIIVESISMCRGIILDGCTYFTVRDCTSIHGMGTGIGAVNSTHGLFDNCRSLYTAFTYGTYPMIGGDGDGFYNGQVQYVTYMNCYAYDFTRIGFVSEGATSLTNSDFVTYINCTADYAHDCIKSTTEFNAAFWAENTINVRYYQCTGRNIDSGINQVPGRVRGYIITQGRSVTQEYTVRDCKIYGVSALSVPITLDAAGPNLNILVDNFFCSNCQQGVAFTGDTATLTIRNLTIDTPVTGFTAAVMQSATASAKQLTIDTVNIRNYGLINGLLLSLGNNPTVSNVLIRNVRSPYSITTNAQLDSLRIVDSDFPVKAGLSATILQVSNSTLRFTQGGSIVGDIIGYTSNGVSAQFDNVLFKGDGTVREADIVGDNSSAKFNNCIFDGVIVKGLASGAAAVIEFSDSTFKNYSIFLGRAIFLNYATVTRLELIISRCRFVADADITATPIRQGTTIPTYTVVSNCTYNTTSLIDWTIGVTQSNNVQTL